MYQTTLSVTNVRCQLISSPWLPDPPCIFARGSGNLPVAVVYIVSVSIRLLRRAEATASEGITRVGRVAW